MGISSETSRVWRGRGEEESSGPYRDFATAIELAELESKAGMIQRLLKDRDAKWTWNILKNRYPHEFKERIATEVSGPDGGPIPGSQNPFVVQIEGVQPPPGFWESFVPESEREAVFGKKPPLNGG